MVGVNSRQPGQNDIFLRHFKQFTPFSVSFKAAILSCVSASLTASGLYLSLFMCWTLTGISVKLIKPTLFAGAAYCLLRRELGNFNRFSQLYSEVFALNVYTEHCHNILIIRHVCFLWFLVNSGEFQHIQR